MAQALLAFQQVEADETEVDAPIDVGRLLIETVQLYAIRAETMGLALTLECGEAVAGVQGRATDLRRILSNLTSNALKYTPAGGRVSIQVDRVADELALTWTDTGIGMTESELDSVWDDFWRSDDPWVRSRPGTGLGLAVVARLVGTLGGRVSIESTPRVGTTVRVHLPVA